MKTLVDDMTTRMSEMETELEQVKSDLSSAVDTVKAEEEKRLELERYMDQLIGRVRTLEGARIGRQTRSTVNSDRQADANGSTDIGGDSDDDTDTQPSPPPRHSAKATSAARSSASTDCNADTRRGQDEELTGDRPPTASRYGASYTCSEAESSSARNSGAYIHRGRNGQTVYMGGSSFAEPNFGGVQVGNMLTRNARGWSGVTGYTDEGF